MKRKKLFITLTIIALLFIGLFSGTMIYLNTYYKADKEKINSYIVEGNFTEEKLKDGSYAYITSSNIGLIFYPGGKVELESYIPLMKEISKNNISCFLLKMPFNLAVFDISKANKILNSYSDISSWYIGGHSLGEAMASSYVSKNLDKFSGLFLLGAYSTNNISSSSLKVLSIYGSNDGVMKRNKYQECLKNLPSNFNEYIIQGGNHAQYGMYGKQKKDKDATISNEEQIKITSEKISSWILN